MFSLFYLKSKTGHIRHGLRYVCKHFYIYVYILSGALVTLYTIYIPSE